MKQIIFIVACLIAVGCSHPPQQPKQINFFDSYQSVKTEYLVANSFEEALSLSAKKNKNILLITTASWCNPCQRMKKDVFPRQDVKEAMSKYIIYFADADRERKFNIGSIPNYGIVNKNKNLIRQSEGYLSANEFIQWLSNSNSTSRSSDTSRCNPGG